MGMPIHRDTLEAARQQGQQEVMGELNRQAQSDAAMQQSGRAGMEAGLNQGRQEGYGQGQMDGTAQGRRQGADEMAASLMAQINNPPQNTGMQPAGLNEVMDQQDSQDPRMEMANQVADLMIASQSGDQNAQAQLEQAAAELQQSEEGTGILDYAGQMANEYLAQQQGPAGMPQ